MPGAGKHAEACDLKAQRDEDGGDEQGDVGELLNACRRGGAGGCRGLLYACNKTENQVLTPNLKW